jgi:hypothetical protein
VKPEGCTKSKRGYAHTTALHEACASGNVEILKRLKPNSTDDLASMLERAAFHADQHILAYLLDLGTNPNGRPDGGGLVRADAEVGAEVWDL